MRAVADVRADDPAQPDLVHFRFVHESEQRLLVAALDREWQFAERGQGTAFKPLTHIEPYIPEALAVE